MVTENQDNPFLKNVRNRLDCSYLPMNRIWSTNYSSCLCTPCKLDYLPKDQVHWTHLEETNPCLVFKGLLSIFCISYLQDTFGHTIFNRNRLPTLPLKASHQHIHPVDSTSEPGPHAPTAPGSVGIQSRLSIVLKPGHKSLKKFCSGIFRNI